MRITIKHGGGDASVRAAGLAAAIRNALDLEVIDVAGADGSFDVQVDGESLVRRHGGPLAHAVGLGWPDSETVIRALRARLELEHGASA